MSESIIGLIIPVITLLFAGIFVLLWLRERQAKHTLFLAGCYVAMAIGFAIQHFTPAPDSKGSFLIMHLVYSTAVICLAMGVGLRAGVSMPLKALSAAVLITAILLLVTNFTDNQNPRLYLTNSCYGLMSAIIALMLTRVSQQQRVDRAILILITLTAVQFYVRPYVAIGVSGPMTTEQYHDSPFYALLLVTVALLATSLAMALVAACVSDQLRRLATESSRDHLTGLKTRRAFENDAIEMLEKAYAENESLSVIVADIDHFKRVNDDWGHQIGDCAIASFGSLLRRMVRASDRVGRIGGEEFCILVWQCELEGAGRLAERIRATFAQSPIEEGGDDLLLTASFGVAQWEPGEGYGKLFARADRALYAAKDAGRDRVCCSPRQGGGAAIVDIATGRTAA
jgi:diguanylate cyclase (GGDEF)-like protein